MDGCGILSAIGIKGVNIAWNLHCAVATNGQRSQDMCFSENEP